MSLAAPFAHHQPFLLESDTLSLSSDFEVRDDILYDLPLRAMHRLHDPGRKVIGVLAATCTYGDLVRTARFHGATDKQLAELLGFLNMIGALRYLRSPRHQVRAVYTLGTHLLFGMFYAPLSWRRPALPVATALGILRAVWPIIVIAACTAVFAAAGGLVSPGFALGISTFGLSLFGGSLFVHEMVHAAVARQHTLQPRLIQCGLRIGIVHRKLVPQAEAFSSIAGPMTGTTVCFIAAFIMLSLDLYLFALLGVIVGTFHVLSLLPWYGDGASFDRALREMRNE